MNFCNFEKVKHSIKIKKMISIHPQFIKDSNGNETLVVLRSKEFYSIMEELDDLADVRLYDQAKKGKQEFIDAEQAFKEIEKMRKKNV